MTTKMTQQMQKLKTALVIAKDRHLKAESPSEVAFWAAHIREIEDTFADYHRAVAHIVVWELKGAVGLKTKTDWRREQRSY